jgi:hypothetical protein
MHNVLSMSATFEKQKNTQAALYTLGITGGLLLLFFLVTMTIPQTAVPQVEEFVEVNLGSGDEGFGTDQPQLPGEPAPAQEATYTPPQPPVIKPAVSKPDATKINAESKTVKANNPSPQPVTTPAPPRPRAVMGRTMGGNGNGGNGADTYRPGGNEGIAGGTGDQGRPGGDPNGRNYSGTPRSFGVKVLSIPNQTFEDDFNQNAKVAMDIVVDDNGKVTSATFQPRGSTTSDRKYVDIARRSAFQLKMGSVDGGQKGTVVFNFKVRG